MEYLGLNRFRARLTSPDAQGAGVGLILERRGVFTWKLVRVELPLDDDRAAPSAQASANPPAPTTDAELTAQLPAAFTAAFGNETSRAIGDNTYAFSPVALLRVGSRYVLIAGGAIPDGAHAEVGTLSVTYLRFGREGFELERQWLDAAGGTAYGMAPSVVVRKDLLSNPVVLASGGGTWQGCTVSSTEVVSLGPAAPRNLGTVLTAYENGEAELDGEIVRTDGQTSFAVTYVGSAAPVERLTFAIRGLKAEPAASVEMPGC